MPHSVHVKAYRKLKALLQGLTFGLSLGFRIYVSAFLILFTTSISFVFLQFFQEKQTSITSDILNVRVTSMQAAQKIKESVVAYDNSIFRFIVTKSDGDLARAKELRKNALMEVDRLKILSNNIFIQSRLVELRSRLQKYFSESNDLVEYARTNNLPASAGVFQAAGWARSQVAIRQEMSVLSAEGSARLQRVFALCDELLTYNSAQLASARNEIDRLLEDSRRWSKSIFYAGIAVVILIAMLLAISLVGPLRILMGGVQQMEGGKLDVELPVTTSTEIGQLTMAFNRMARTIHLQRERLMKETITDSLTGVFNQRYFIQRLGQEFERSKRNQEPLSLMMVDVDHFKKYNDTFGHELGNVILRRIASTIQSNLRNVDLLFRYGGDEFSVILPNADENEARKTAERLIEVVRVEKFPGVESIDGPKITLSIGGASYPSGAQSCDDLIAKADEMLYCVKKKGRNDFEWFDVKVSLG